MKNSCSYILLAFALIIAYPVCYGQDKHGEMEPVLMGASQVNITPSVPVPMSGYAARKDPFTGVHDQLFASALCFKSSKTALLIITADLIGFNMQFIDETKKMVSTSTGIKPENIMITAAHNHGAPVTKAYEKDVPEAVENYIKELQQKFVDISLQALEKAAPFKMGTGKGSCSMNVNRRAEFADGSIWLGRAPDKPCDHEVDVVRFDDFNNNTLAVFVNWPCHGTASGQENTEITGDWPGAAARYIKKQTGDDMVVAITAGASGDINPIYGPGKNFDEIEAVGFHVGKAAWETFNNITTYPVESIDANNTSLTLPGKKACKDRFPQSSYESAPDVEIRLTTFRIGDMVLAGISGEVMNEIGSNIKKQSPFSNTIIVTHCNGSSGYICTDKAFPEGGYEVMVTHLMPGAEKPLTEKILQMIYAL
jgi:neutral ceramidase